MNIRKRLLFLFVPVMAISTLLPAVSPDRVRDQVNSAYDLVHTRLLHGDHKDNRTTLRGMGINEGFNDATYSESIRNKALNGFTSNGVEKSGLKGAYKSANNKNVTLSLRHLHDVLHHVANCNHNNCDGCNDDRLADYNDDLLGRIKNYPYYNVFTTPLGYVQAQYNKASANGSTKKLGYGLALISAAGMAHDFYYKSDAFTGTARFLLGEGAKLTAKSAELLYQGLISTKLFAGNFLTSEIYRKQTVKLLFGAAAAVCVYDYTQKTGVAPKSIPAKISKKIASLGDITSGDLFKPANIAALTFIGGQLIDDNNVTYQLLGSLKLNVGSDGKKLGIPSALEKNPLYFGLLTAAFNSVTWKKMLEQLNDPNMGSIDKVWYAALNLGEMVIKTGVVALVTNWVNTSPRVTLQPEIAPAA